MPASANWPDRTLISPILTVPCALADAMPSSSAMTQPNPTRSPVIVHPPGLLVAEQLQKIVLMEVCAVEKFDTPRRWAAPHCERRAPMPQRSLADLVPSCADAMELERPRADAFSHALHWRGRPRRLARHACELCRARPMASVPARIDAARLERRRRLETAETIAT